MSTETRERELSRLESLPGELRNRIYRYAVVEEGLVNAATCTNYERARKWQSNEPALASTCKQFRKEVLPIYYAENIFTFAKPGGKYLSRNTVDAWVDTIGELASYIVRVGAPVDIRQRLPDGSIKREECDVMAKIHDDPELVEFQCIQEVDGQWLVVLEKAKYYYMKDLEVGFRPISGAMCLCHDYFDLLAWPKQKSWQCG